MEILRDTGSGHPAFGSIANAVLSMLDKARQTAPQSPAYLPGLLRLCQRIRIPKVGTWFGEEIKTLANGPDGTERRWGGYEQTKEVVFAALVQSPGLRTAASRPSWLVLLEQPRYSTLALLALGTSFREQAAHLSKWWRNCVVSERQSELSQLIFTALKTEGAESIFAVLKPLDSLPGDLKRAINAALQENGANRAFADVAAQPAPRRPLTGAIAGAGWRREVVLQKA